MSATTFLRRRNYAGDTCKNEEFPAATFGKAFCIFRYLGVAKNSFRIKQCRKAQKITQEQLAELVDISPHYLYEIERGIKCVSLPILYDIAKVLHTSIDYLVFGTQDLPYSYVYTDELNEILLDLTPQKRQMLAHIVKTIIPYLRKE